MAAPVVLLVALTALCVGLLQLFGSGCAVDEKCFDNGDCEEPKVCDAQGQCVYECDNDKDCGIGFLCRGHLCEPAAGDEPLDCPQGSASVLDSYCIDIYEASRPDATAEDFGVDESYATSRVGVLPWKELNNESAQQACVAAGKQLCTPQQWQFACRGPYDTDYAYGDDYDPYSCNGIDAFGDNKQHLTPSGSFPECTNGFGVYDLNGNLWEQVAAGNVTKVRGGAYNCRDSAKLHQCDYVPETWAPLAVGFRCCWIPE